MSESCVGIRVCVRVVCRDQSVCQSRVYIGIRVCVRVVCRVGIRVCVRVVCRVGIRVCVRVVCRLLQYQVCSVADVPIKPSSPHRVITPG